MQLRFDVVHQRTDKGRLLAELEPWWKIGPSDVYPRAAGPLAGLGTLAPGEILCYKGNAQKTKNQPMLRSISPSSTATMGTKGGADD
jgi:hypothetical protein